MNYHSRILGVAVTASTVLLAVPLLAVTRADRDFYRAIESGATAQLTVKVVDDVGRPVGGVNIEARFAPAFNAPGEKKLFTTDTNGIAIVSGRTGKSVSLRTTKDGFYGSSEKIDYVALGQGVKGVKWLPWGMKKEIVLRPVKKPKTEQFKIRGYKHTKRLNEWLRFDLEYGDFVSPDGKGKTGDFEVLFNWDGGMGNKYTGMGVKIRFMDKYSGGCYVNKVMCSDFSGAYAFPLSQDVHPEFSYFVREKRNHDTGELIEREARKFDETKALLVRSRCEIDPLTGKLLKCHYSQISDIQFGCNSDEGIVFLVKSFYNPTPNDTNLEPKR